MYFFMQNGNNQLYIIFYMGEFILKVSTIDIMGQFADLKDTDYKNTLAITVLIDLFIEKGFFTREDFAQKSWELEESTMAEIATQRRLEVLNTLQEKTANSKISQL